MNNSPRGQFQNVMEARQAGTGASCVIMAKVEPKWFQYGGQQVVYGTPRGAQPLELGLRWPDTGHHGRKLTPLDDHRVEDVNAQDLINSISSIDKSIVKDVRVFDVYQGDNIPENKKSIAISVTIQSSEKTLNETDLEQINNLIIKTVENKTGAKIRS